MTIVRLITVLEVPLRETRVRDIIASEALLMRARHNQIARGPRLFTYLTFVKTFYFVTNWKSRRPLNLRLWQVQLRMAFSWDCGAVVDYRAPIRTCPFRALCGLCLIVEQKLCRPLTRALKATSSFMEEKQYKLRLLLLRLLHSFLSRPLSNSATSDAAQIANNATCLRINNLLRLFAIDI